MALGLLAGDTCVDLAWWRLFFSLGHWMGSTQHIKVLLMGVHNEDHEYLVFLHYLYIESFSQWVQLDGRMQAAISRYYGRNQRAMSLPNYKRPDVQRR